MKIAGFSASAWEHSVRRQQWLLTFSHDGNGLGRRIGKSCIVQICLNDGLYDGFIDEWEEIGNVCREIRRGRDRVYEVVAFVAVRDSQKHLLPCREQRCRHGEYQLFLRR